MTAESVAVGTELLLGDIADTNSAELGKTLAQFGVLHLRRQTVGDNLERLTEALSLALSRSDIVFTIGGLGPTLDDLTRDGIAAALGETMVKDDAVEQGIREKLEKRGIPFVGSQSRQAMRPPSASVIENPNGTAPGLICKRGDKVVVALPGPRLEFVPMLHGPVSDFLRSLGQGTIATRTLKIVGMGESMVEEKLRDLMQGEDPTVAPYAKTGEVHVRIASRASTDQEADKKMAPVEQEVRRRLGKVVYGLDEDTLESVVLRLLRERKETLAVAESCTGGGLGERITTVPGSSDVFLGGVVSYSNDLKRALLGVTKQTLEEHGAVSEQCAREMAEGAIKATNATWALSVTGIAGPDGGTNGKPVGLVYIGCSGPKATHVTKNQFGGNREAVRERSQKAALALLLTRLR